jgi:acyl dehydratase
MARTVTTIDELSELVGQELTVGPWLEITQERINAFADVTGDHQWIHVDEQRAKEGPFGATIAHGFLTLSLIPTLQRDAEGTKVDLPRKMGVNYGLNRVRFPAPVRVGKRIRSRTRLLSLEQVATDVYQMVNQVTVEIEGESKPAMVAETVTRAYL